MPDRRAPAVGAVTGTREDAGSILDLEPGEYGKVGGVWAVYPPPMGKYEHPWAGPITKHTIEEHEDGTITVTPSILQRDTSGHEAWHGFLKRGVWTIV